MSVAFKNGESNRNFVYRNAVLILLCRVIEEQGRSTIFLLLFDSWWYSFALSSSKVLQDRYFSNYIYKEMLGLS